MLPDVVWIYLVDREQILLINCGEIYARLPTLDRHHERFLASSHSIPDIKDKYGQIKVTTISIDKSVKLVIGTFTFNLLVTSSLRLDKDTFKPQLGCSTAAFKPSQNTKIYLSSHSHKSAMAILDKKKVLFHPYDVMSQLRQLRSKFSSRSTYSISRSCSAFTNNLSCRPYMIFTVADSDGLSIETDTKIGSRIMQLVAEAMLVGDEHLGKHRLEKFTQEKKKTRMHNYLDDILKLFGDNNQKLKIINNQELDSILCEIVNLITPKLPEYNEKITDNIMQAIISLK